MLAVGILEVGRLVAVRIAVESAAREGAFFAATRLAGDTSDQEIRQAAARESSESLIQADPIHVVVEYPSPDIVLVTARSAYSPLVPLPGLLVGSDPIWVSASAAFPLTVPSPASGAIATRVPLPTSTATETPTESPTATNTPLPALTETPTPTPTATPNGTPVAPEQAQ